ncbi:MAG: aminotransferase class III-fold pyridoxal phosphate-dependent enzyme, partial [Bacteroidales bacterium]|nr:aminotransferase class III-fold pyridoxal phosphate-dependent enzyme [Bacteroidales bacterium]
MDSWSYTSRELFFRHLGQTSPTPLGIEILKAKGVFLYGPNGKSYLDLVSGVSVSNVGHSNPEVTDAVVKQAESHMHLMVYGEVIQNPQIEHAQLLTSLLPPSLQVVYYVNSGSEAAEAALKLAKRYTGRREIISCRNCYHGSTHGAISLMSDQEYKRAFRPLLPGISHIRFNSEEDLSMITGRTACVIIEPVQGEAGVILPSAGYLEKLRQRCNECGTLLIFDEIQTGFGRCGKLFALEKYKVIPDIVIFAKALGGGMPLGALVTSSEIMDCFKSNPSLGHITTFGGHPVSCAAALAALRILLREDWIARVEERSRRFSDSLSAHSMVKEIRASGLLLAVDLKNSEAAGLVIKMLP